MQASVVMIRPDAALAGDLVEAVGSGWDFTGLGGNHPTTET